MSLRIAHIDTEKTWRGGEQQAFSLIQGLINRGHKNFAVVKKGSALAAKIKGVIPLLEVRPFGELDLLAAHRINRFLKSHQIDVVHAHTGHSVALAALATLGTRIPVVITRRVDFHLGHNFFTAWKYRRAAHIIAISENVKKILVQDGIAPEKIRIIASGVDLKRFERGKAVSKTDLGFTEGNVIVGQVAALVPHKDPATFLEALAILFPKFPNVRAVFLGEGELQKSLERRSSELQISDRVRFLGYQADPLNYLAAFDIFCLSSKLEGLGTSVLDAMALKIPVVATRAGGIPEMVEDGVNGYLAEPSDPRSLAQALERCLLDRQVNQPLLQNALKTARNFDINHTVDKTLALYEHMCKNK